MSYGADTEPVHIFSKTFTNSGAAYTTTVYYAFDNYGIIYIPGNQPSSPLNLAGSYTATIPSGTFTMAVNAWNAGGPSPNPAGFWLQFRDPNGNYFVTNDTWSYNGTTPVQALPCGPAPTKPGCQWTEIRGASIDSLQCPPGSSGSWGKDRCNVSDLSTAKANCESDPACSGITSQVDAAHGGSDIPGWEPRSNRNGYRTWPGVTSYECKRS
jgi:hypothetical protein